MWLFASTLAVCITVIYLARTLGVPKLEVYVSPKPTEPPASNTEPVPTPPLEVMMFCARESEPHAREVMLARAHKLYEKHNDWGQVLSDLQQLEQDD
jgi:hypothetical protein